MSNNQNVLGKGLRSLIPDAADKKDNYWGPTVQTISDTEQIIKVSPSVISANPFQPRTGFDKEKLQELADSIKEYGIIQPLIVTQPAPGKYQLIAGERRLKAAKLLDLSQVPVVVRKAEEQKKLELSLIENIQRHDLNPLEEALSYRRLIDEFGLTQEEVAQQVGKSRSSVANFVRLLTLPKKILEAIASGQITFSHAKVILSYQTEKEQLIALKKILKQGLTVAQATDSGKKKKSEKDKDPVLAAWEQKLTSYLGFNTHIKKQSRGGVIEISYTSEEDLKTLLDKLFEE